MSEWDLQVFSRWIRMHTPLQFIGSLGEIPGPRECCKAEPRASVRHE